MSATELTTEQPINVTTKRSWQSLDNYAATYLDPDIPNQLGTRPSANTMLSSMCFGVTQILLRKINHETYMIKTMFQVSQHYNDVIMSTIASQITSLTIVYSIAYSGADQKKHQSSASLAFVREIHRWPVISPHKGPVTRKMFPSDDVITGFGHTSFMTYSLSCFNAFVTIFNKKLTCLLAKTSNTASLSSSSFMRRFTSSLASTIFSESLLSTT